jgi:membrane protein required for colicin V production
VETYDLVMLAVLAGATLFGAWKGLAWQVASLASIFAGYFMAYRFRGPVGSLIDASPPWNTFLAMLILYVGTSLAIWLAFGLVSGFLDRLKLKEFDRQIGALLGLATGVLLCVLITLFAVTLLGDEQKASVCRSRSGYYIAVLLDRAGPVMPSEVRDVVRPYVRSLDEKVQRPPLDGSLRPAPASLR